MEPEIFDDLVFTAVLESLECPLYRDPVGAFVAARYIGWIVRQN